jgi:hypothetical protein
MQEEIAPMITNFEGDNDLKLEDIDPGLVDPVLKCIQGDYTGRFV